MLIFRIVCRKNKKVLYGLNWIYFLLNTNKDYTFSQKFVRPILHQSVMDPDLSGHLDPDLEKNQIRIQNLEMD